MKANIPQILFVEAIIVIALIGVLSGLAVKSYTKIIKVVSLFEGIELAVPLKQDIYAYYSYYGIWPNSNDMKKIEKYEKNFKGIKKIDVIKGSFFITFTGKVMELDNKTLAFRKVQFTDVPGSPVNWLCGYQKTPTGMSVDIENKTTVNNMYLPKGCI